MSQFMPGPKNLITDVSGLRVGNADDTDAGTGVTVILPDAPAVIAADVRGGAPGTREIEALAPTSLVEKFHGIVLSGGSVFGLEAAAGTVGWLVEQGIGLDLTPLRIPVVPSAILYDLPNGGRKNWGREPPYRALGWTACANAADDFALGNAGAGFGATAGLLKGGLGSASSMAGGAPSVGALAAVNCYGAVTMPGSPVFWAWPFEQGNEFGGRRPATARVAPAALEMPPPGLASPLNTTLAVIATDAALTKPQAQRVAIMAHDGLARAIRPVHTPFDGDTVFVIATGTCELGAPVAHALAELGARAADCLARAVARGVFAAESYGTARAYREVFGMDA